MGRTSFLTCLVAIVFTQSHAFEADGLPREGTQLHPAGQLATAGSAQTAAAAAQTAAVAAQAAAAAAASAAQSAADAAAAPSLAQSAPVKPAHSIHEAPPVMQKFARLGTSATQPSASGATSQPTTAVAAIKAATDAARLEKTAAVAAASAESAAQIAHTAAKANQAAAEAASAAKIADTDAKVHQAAADAVKADAVANAAASALKAADSAASAAASAASAARAAKNVEKPKSAQAVPEVKAPGLQVTAQLPVPVSNKDLQRLPVEIAASGSWSSAQWWMLQLANLYAGISFAMVIKALCVAGNVMVQVSPLPQARRWECRKCTGDADAAPYVSIAYGGWQWCFYGFFAWWVTGRSGFLILVHSNFLAAVLGLYYVSAFYRNCRSEENLASLQKYASSALTLVCLQMCGLMVLPAERALFLTGLVSSFCSFIGSTSVLVTVPQVIRTKDSKSIPGPYACANFCSSVVWSVCGWILNDPMVSLPALFSTCCSMTAISCKVMYPTVEGDEKQPLEEGLTKKTFMAKTSKAESKGANEFTPIKPALMAALGAKAGSNTPRAPLEDYDGTGGTC